MGVFGDVLEEAEVARKGGPAGALPAKDGRPAGLCLLMLLLLCLINSEDGYSRNDISLISSAEHISKSKEKLHAHINEYC